MSENGCIRWFEDLAERRLLLDAARQQTGGRR